MPGTSAVGRLLGVICLPLVVWGCLAGHQVEHGNVAFDVSPDGRKIVFSGADGDLYLLDLRALKVERVNRSATADSAPSFSPDGQSVVYTAGDGGRNGNSLYLLPLAGGTPRRVTSDAKVWDSAPSFSPDGSKVTFVRAHLYRQYSIGGMTWSNYDVYVVNADGTGLRRLTNQNYYGARRPGFTRDGEDVFYAADEPYDAKNFGQNIGGSMRTIVRVPADGAGQPSPVLPLPEPGLNIGALGSEPAFSRDGKLITFISDKLAPFEYDICTMKPDGSDVRPLHVTTISHYNQQPTFLPDGKSILFLAGTESNAGARPIFSLWQVDTDGRNAREIADGSLFTDPSKWKPKR